MTRGNRTPTFRGQFPSGIVGRPNFLVASRADGFIPLRFRDRSHHADDVS
jgi:hypothetical protein